MTMMSSNCQHTYVNWYIYSFTLYEKVKRATITLENEEFPILMASFDIQADHDHIIMDKILPIIRKEGL